MKDRLYAVTVTGLRNGVVYSIAPFSTAVFTRKSAATNFLREILKENVGQRAALNIEGGIEDAEAWREARRNFRGVWRVATYQRVS